MQTVAGERVKRREEAVGGKRERDGGGQTDGGGGTDRGRSDVEEGQMWRTVKPQSGQDGRKFVPEEERDLCVCVREREKTSPASALCSE